MKSLVVSLLAPAAVPRVLASTGNAVCPCISPTLADWTDGATGMLKATVGAKEYLYDAAYGKASCLAHDSDKPPVCATSAGAVNANRPDWCAKSWCYVDPNNCAATISKAQSLFLAGSTNIYYSYQTCGASNSFTSWQSSNSEARQMLTVVENTLSRFKTDMEDHWVLLHGGTLNTTACSAHRDMNTCAGCPVVPAGTNWVGSYTHMDFADTGAFIQDPADVNLKCLGDSVKNQWLRIAQAEYDMISKNRVAYLYMGFATHGDYLQWPAAKWVRNDFDPRYRPWYAMIASGPKNVIIVIDTSGSMSQSSRMDLAKQAAIKVLGTLTWLDYFMVIGFSSGVQGNARHLIPASEGNIAKATTWINSLYASGSTNFVDSLGTAFDRAKRGQTFEGSEDLDRCFSAQCKSVILFMSDGVPSTWDSNHEQNLRNLNPNPTSVSGFRLFTYALGSGADTTVLARLAADHGGQLQAVSDGGNLANSMADYYKFVSGDRNTNAARWMRYTDVVSSETLLAGCVAIDDKRTGQAANTLLAVACMDANVIVAPLSQLEQLSGYAAFATSYESNSRTCAAGNNPYLEMSTLSCSSFWERPGALSCESRNCLADGSIDGGGSSASSNSSREGSDDGGAVAVVLIAVIGGFAAIGAAMYGMGKCIEAQKKANQRPQAQQQLPGAGVPAGAVPPYVPGGGPQPQPGMPQYSQQGGLMPPQSLQQYTASPRQSPRTSGVQQFGAQYNSPSPRPVGGGGQYYQGTPQQTGGGGRAQEPMIVVVERQSQSNYDR